MAPNNHKINTILVDNEFQGLNDLERKIRHLFPEINISGKASSVIDAHQLILSNSPELIFLETSQKSCLDFFVKFSSFDFETIFVTSLKNHAIEAIKYCAIGFLLKPIQNDDLLIAVRNAQKRIKEKEEGERNKRLLDRVRFQNITNNIIGIPTMKGLDFIATCDIIRCEGLQKCTRIVTKDQSDIISSYNLGEFKKLLQDFDFFSVHKSHFINMRHIKQYYKEGSIIMSDNSAVPLAKRKKSEFLKQVSHI